MNDPDNQYLGVTKESTISVQVPAPQLTELNVINNGEYNPHSPYIGYSKVTVSVPQIWQNETIQNKRLQSNGNYIISTLMQNPTDYDGISKTSNIIVDVPELDVTQISNYSITQNGTQTVPIPSGYDAVDSISLNVQVPQSTGFTINNIVWPNNTTKNISTFTKRTTSGNVTFSQYYLCVIIDSQNQGFWRVRVTYQNTQNQQYVYAPGFYATLNIGSGATNSTVNFRDSNNTEIFKMNDPDRTSSIMSEVNLSKDIFYWDISI